LSSSSVLFGDIIYPPVLGKVKAILGLRLRNELHNSAAEQGAGGLASVPSLNNLQTPDPVFPSLALLPLGCCPRAVKRKKCQVGKKFSFLFLLINPNDSKFSQPVIPASKWKIHDKVLWNTFQFARNFYHNEIGLQRISWDSSYSQRVSSMLR